jgi:palmitoyl transferase
LRFILSVVMLWLSLALPAQAACDPGEDWSDRLCRELSQTWSQGRDEVYLPFRAHHMRYAYTQEKIDSYREDSWGLGYGRSRYDEDGNWQGWYGMVFLDSHSKPQPILGYGYQWIWGPPQGLHAGLGYTVLVTARDDVLNYLPLPGILPIASVNYGRASLNASFLPGGKGNGNIVFLWGRYGF